MKKKRPSTSKTVGANTTKSVVEDLSHDADRYDRTLRDEIHFAEKGERREQNVADSAIKETVDTELRNED